LNREKSPCGFSQNDRWRERFFGIGRPVMPQNDIIIGTYVVIKKVKR